jgi:uncharacterized lipoprotein YajG
MMRLLISQKTTLTGILCAIAVAAFAAGCATPPSAPPPPDVSLLTAAGFKIIVAKTKEQQEHLQTLPPGQIRAMQRTGTEFFVYPDAARNQLYVGTQKEYQAYLKLHPNNNVDLQSQSNAKQDMNAYLKQDAAMTKETQRENSDPYYWWPSWSELGW